MKAKAVDLAAFHLRLAWDAIATAEGFLSAARAESGVWSAPNWRGVRAWAGCARHNLVLAERALGVGEKISGRRQQAKEHGGASPCIRAESPRQRRPACVSPQATVFTGPTLHEWAASHGIKIPGRKWTKRDAKQLQSLTKEIIATNGEAHFRRMAYQVEKAHFAKKQNNRLVRPSKC